MDIEKLASCVNKSGKTPTEIAASVGITTASWYNKISGKSKFSVDEAVALRKCLGLTKSEIVGIFFDK